MSETFSDTDECAEGEHSCDVTHGQCFNIEGSYECACDHGYIGDGYYCEEDPGTFKPFSRTNHCLFVSKLFMLPLVMYYHISDATFSPHADSISPEIVPIARPGGNYVHSHSSHIESALFNRPHRSQRRLAAQDEPEQLQWLGVQ